MDVSFVVDCLYVLELDTQSLWLAPYQPINGWNNGIISLCTLILKWALSPLRGE